MSEETVFVTKEAEKEDREVRMAEADVPVE